MYIDDNLISELLEWNQKKKDEKVEHEERPTVFFQSNSKHLKKANHIQEKNWGKEYEFVDVDSEIEISSLLIESNHIYAEYFVE